MEKRAVGGSVWLDAVGADGCREGSIQGIRRMGAIVLLSKAGLWGCGAAVLRTKVPRYFVYSK